ncbi:hypothetical protein K438DRAFT_1959332 [Mycena galopus ATCC 62051]|nr:hypothetical protein K438DRAFT_1959332 [Mycena galopus ATCC 62051]
MESNLYYEQFERSKVDDFLLSKSDDVILPSWSHREGALWYSFLAPSSDIPESAMQHLNTDKSILPSLLTSEVSPEMNCFDGPVWYKPQEHWVPWILKVPASPSEEDPLGFLFIAPVSYEEVTEDLYGMDSEDSDQEKGKTTDVGYRVVPEWATPAINMARRLNNMAKELPKACPWYCQPYSTIVVGDLPALVEVQSLLWVHEDEEEVRSLVVLFKRSCLSLLGFIAWISTVMSIEDTLSMEDAQFLPSLNLDERDKVGVLYQLERDYHEVNFPHLLEHGVPIHGILTDEMREDWRFLRLRREVWTEVEETLHDCSMGKLYFSDLPSYSDWANDWSRSDWFFQNL